MKIFTNQNGIEKAYIQYEDLSSIRDYYGPIPDTLLSKSDNEDALSFLLLDRPAEIEFIKNADWIIELNEINLSEEELIKTGETIAYEMNKLAVKHNHEADEIVRKRYKIQHRLLNHKIKSYANILLMKKGQLIIPIPNITSNNELVYDDIGYEAYTSINPFIVTIRRKDRNQFNSIPFDVVNKVVEIVKEKNNVDVEYKYNTSLSPDKKSVIITLMFDKMIKVETKNIISSNTQINNISLNNNRKYIISNENIEPYNFMKMVQYIFKKH